MMINKAKSVTRKLVRDPLAFCLDSRFAVLNRYGDNSLDQQRSELIALGEQNSDVLVTVIMTAYNTGAHVESALRSILDQSHQNLEIMVIDDASTDETLNILLRLARQDKRVKIVSSKVNHGTYWSKNWCLMHARGEYVAFHDSDDVSHPDRIRLQLGAFQKWQDMKACTVRWQRIVEGSDDSVLMEGKASRMALISLMIKRKPVIERAGYFDCIRIAADSEYIARLGHLFGRKGVRNLRHVLYTGLLREGSLTTGNAGGTLWNLTRQKTEQNGPLNFERTLQGERALYHQAFHAWHTEMMHEVAKNPKALRLGFPNDGRPFDVSKSLTGGCGDTNLDLVQEVS
jgi:hypothetical protein